MLPSTHMNSKIKEKDVTKTRPDETEWQVKIMTELSNEHKTGRNKEQERD